jgi:hypothetical protein
MNKRCEHSGAPFDDVLDAFVRVDFPVNAFVATLLQRQIPNSLFSQNYTALNIKYTELALSNALAAVSFKG